MTRKDCKAFRLAFAGILLAAGLSYAEPVPLILDLKDDLKLTEKQQGEIKAIYTRLYKDRRLSTAKITIIDLELEELIEKEADLEQIRKKLNEKNELQINLRIREMETTRRVNRLLFPEQLQRWKNTPGAPSR